jgi:hypothetical protein
MPYPEKKKDLQFRQQNSKAKKFQTHITHNLLKQT